MATKVNTGYSMPNSHRIRAARFKKANAYKNGRQVLKDLNGYTSEKEQNNIRTVLNSIDEENINEFFKGYNKERGGDDCFGQSTKAAYFGGCGALAVAPLGLIGLGIAGISILGGGLYIDSKEPKCDNFFTQLNSEYGFYDKQEIMLAQVKKYKAFLEKNTTDKAKEINFLQKIINKKFIEPADCKQLDKITSGFYI